MGYIRHHAIIVTSWDEERLRTAFDSAGKHGLAHLRTSIVKYQVNSGGSFAVMPDGSKEGWAESDEADEKRESFLAALDSMRYDDGSTPVDWVLVQFGDDDMVTTVCDSSDDRYAKRLQRQSPLAPEHPTSPEPSRAGGSASKASVHQNEETARPLPEVE